MIYRKSILLYRYKYRFNHSDRCRALQITSDYVWFVCIQRAPYTTLVVLVLSTCILNITITREVYKLLPVDEFNPILRALLYL